MAGEYRFSFGPWNIHTGADPFGPSVRDEIAFGTKLKVYKKLGFDGVQFHDDDAVPDMNGYYFFSSSIICWHRTKNVKSLFLNGT
jgi:hypothetical protein